MFAFGDDLGTPIGQLIMRATAEHLLGADWGTNMEIVDHLNSNPSSRFTTTYFLLTFDSF